MSSLLLEIADTVTADLNAGGFSRSFTAVRRLLPRRELTELGTDVLVTVVPKSIEVATASRAHNQHDCQVDIAVQRKVASAEDEALDWLMELTQQIADHFRLRTLDSFPAACWIKTEYPAVYAPEHLENHLVFTGLVTLTFRLLQ